MNDNMNILLVEDDDLDAYMLERALKKVDPSTTLIRARDGIDALEVLEEDAAQHTIERPYVILLDINMPRMNGHEFLSKVRQTEALKNACVLVFTTSDNQRDITEAYQHNANGYIVKPDSASELTNILQALKRYWSVCEHPMRGLPNSPMPLAS